MPTPAQSVPYFGRAWSVSITPQGSGQTVTIVSAGALPAMRVLFECEKKMLVVVQQAVVTIYNLGNKSDATQAITSQSAYNISPPTPNMAADPLLFTQNIAMGAVVTVCGGYSAFGSGAAFTPSPSNQLYTGNLMQAIATRENVTDTKLILRCVQNLAVASFGSTNLVRSKNQSDWNVISAIADANNIQLDVDAQSQSILSSRFYSRGTVIVDRPFDAINDLVKQNPGLLVWPSQSDEQAGITIQAVTSLPTTPSFTYSPPNLSGLGSVDGTIKPTILGTPAGILVAIGGQQAPGISFRVLLDSDVRIGMMVAIALGTAINSFQFPYGTVPPLPAVKGQYIVAGIRHVGDTRGRGDDWFTEITALSAEWYSGAAAALKAVASSN